MNANLDFLHLFILKDFVKKMFKLIKKSDQLQETMSHRKLQHVSSLEDIGRGWDNNPMPPIILTILHFNLDSLHKRFFNVRRAFNGR